MATDDQDNLLKQPVDLPDQPTPNHVKNFKNKGKFLNKKTYLIGVIGLVLLGGGAAVLQVGDSSNSQADSTPQPSQVVNQPATKNDVPVAGQTKAFTSDILGLEIKHPSSWSVTDKDGGIFIASPEFTYETPEGVSTAGSFIVYIRQGARDIDGKYIGRGYAVQPSEMLVYTNPGNDQRKDTNFTQFGFDESDNFGFFMVTGDFSLNKDDTLGPNYGREPDTYIIVGGFGAKSQADALGFNSVPLDNYQNTNAYKQALDIVKSIKLN